MACGIFVPRPGIEPLPPASGAWNLNHWITREVPRFLNHIYFWNGCTGTSFLSPKSLSNLIVFLESLYKQAIVFLSLLKIFSPLFAQMVAHCRNFSALCFFFPPTFEYISAITPHQRLRVSSACLYSCIVFHPVGKWFIYQHLECFQFHSTIWHMCEFICKIIPPW